MYSPSSDAELLRNKARRRFGQHMPDVLFEALPLEHQALVLERTDDRGLPILSLDDSDAWIVLTESHLIGAATETTHAVQLAAMKGDYSVQTVVAGEFDKAHARQVQFEGEDAWFQAPSAESLSLLLNVLQVVFNSNAKATPSA